MDLSSSSLLSSICVDRSWGQCSSKCFVCCLLNTSLNSRYSSGTWLRSMSSFTMSVTKEQWMFLVVTLDRCSGRTQWNSSLNCSPTYTTTTVAVPYNPMVTCLFQNVLWSPDLIMWLGLLIPLIMPFYSIVCLEIFRLDVWMLWKSFPTRGSHNTPPPIQSSILSSGDQSRKNNCPKSSLPTPLMHIEYL